MKKIIVIGCPGSGKTTFALKLGEKLGIPLFHLDAIWHKPDKTHISREDFDNRLTDILDCESFIIDGNYGRTLERRLIACDTVFLFDLPTDVCLDGARARLGTHRCDLPWTDTELDPRFKDEILGFAGSNLPTIYALIDKYKDGRTVIVFKSREDAELFVASITPER